MALNTITVRKQTIELVDSLLQLYEVSLTDDLTTLTSQFPPPMELAMNLVTTMTSLLRNKDDYLEESTFSSEQFGSQIFFLNNETMSKIPHDTVIWYPDITKHIQRLILRCAVVFCYTLIKNKSNKQEIFYFEEIQNLLLLLKNMNYNKDITTKYDYGDLKQEDNDESQLDYTKKLPDIAITKENCERRQFDSINQSPSVLIAADILQNIFEITLASLDIANTNVKRLAMVISLIQEFHSAGGYFVLSEIIIFICTLKLSGDDHTNNETIQFQDNKCQSILAQLRNLIEGVKLSKTEYMHMVMCSKRRHGKCSSKSFVNVHHDILGDMQYNSNYTAKENEDFEKENMCVVASVYRFFTKLLPRSPIMSSYLRSVFLLSVDRIGICTCMSPTFVTFPLFTILPKYPEIAGLLGVLGRLLIQQKISKELANCFYSESTPTVSSPDIDLCVVINPEVDNFLNILSNENCKTSRHLTDALRQEEVLSIFQQNKVEWFCLIMYKYLFLKSSTDSCKDLMQLVLNHVKIVVEHLDDQAILLIFSLVLMPLLLHVTDTKIINSSTKSKRLNKRKSKETSATVDTCKSFSVNCQELETCLQVIGKLLQTNMNCRKVFIRHNGMKSLVKLIICERIFVLKGLTILQKDFNATKNIQSLALNVFTQLLTHPTVLSQDSLSSVFDLKRNESVESDLSYASPVKEGVVKTLFKGISGFKQSSPKYSKKLKQSSNKLGVNLDSGSSQKLGWMSLEINEVRAFTSGVKQIVKSIKQFTMYTCRFHKTFPLKNQNQNLSSSINSNISDESYSQEVNIEILDTLSSSSDTTGYHSRSRESSFECIEENDSKNDIENLILPLNNPQSMHELFKLWEFYSSTLQYNKELQECFAIYDGPDTALKLLNLATNSIIPSRNGSSSEFTTSLNTSLVTQVENPDTFSTNTEVFVAEDTDIVKSRSSSMSNIEGECSSKVEIEETRKENFFTIPCNDQVNGCEEIELKIKLLSITLDISLVSTTINTNEHDVAIDDVISTVKPILQQSNLTRGPYCMDLCQGLFNSSVQKIAINSPPRACYTAAMLALYKEITQSICNRQKTNSNFTEYLSTPIKSNTILRKSSSPLSSMDDISFYGGNFSSENDSDDERLSTTDGYQGDSESDTSVAFDRNGSLSSSGDLGLSSRVTKPEINSFVVMPGPILHPDILLLIVEIMGDPEQKNETSIGIPQSRNGTYRGSIYDESDDFRQNIKTIVETLNILASYSINNVELMVKHCDLVSACFTSFVSLLDNNLDHNRDLQREIFKFCLKLNKHHMTARHLRQIFSLLNAKSPPLEQILRYVLEIVRYQQNGPSHFLHFPHETSTLQTATTDAKEREKNAKKNSVWNIAAIQICLGSRISWPVADIGVTVVSWIRLKPKIMQRKLWKKSAKSDITNSWDQSRVVEIDMYGNLPMQRASNTEEFPFSYLHVFTIGSKQTTMLQIWLKNDVFVFRICLDPNDGKSVGILAETQCSDLLGPDDWNHVTFTYTQNTMPDKTILGKVHVIVNCSIERDVILEYNMPKLVLSRRSDFYLLAGHTVENRLEQEPSYDFGNISVFNRIHFTIKNAFMLECLGPDVGILSESLISNSRMTPTTTTSCRVKYKSPDCVNVSPFKKNTPFSMFVMNFSINDFGTSDNMFDAKMLQESLVLAFRAYDPTFCLINNKAAGSLRQQQDRRSLFSRGFLSNQPSPEYSVAFDPLLQEFEKHHVTKSAGLKSSSDRGLNVALNQVGGIQVFLLYYAKIVEATSSLWPADSLTDIENLQCVALQTLLHIRAEDIQRQQEFASCNAVEMLYKVMTKSQCKVGFKTLQVVFNACCSGDIVIEDYNEKQPVDFQVNYNTTAVLHDHEIFFTLILDWKIWHGAYAGNSQSIQTNDKFPVWEALLHGIRALIREDHPEQWQNIKKMVKGKIVQRFLNGLQQMVVDGIKPFPVKSITALMVDIIKTVIGVPQDVNLLTSICDFLIAIHPPAGTFVYHMPSSFYFNLKTRKFDSLESYKKSTETSQSNPVTPTEKQSFKRSQEKFGLSRTTSAPDSSPAKLARRKASLFINKSRTTNSCTEEDTNSYIKDISSLTKSVPDLSQQLLITDSTETTLPESLLFQKSTGSNEKKDRKPLGPKIAPIKKTGISKPKVLFSPVLGWENLPHVNNPIELVTSPMKHQTEVKKNLTEDMEATTNVEITPEETKISDVTIEILKMLFISVMSMDESNVYEFVGKSLSASNLIVLTHHKCIGVRAATIRLLGAYLSRCSIEEQAYFMAQKGFHLVANQLHQYPTERSLVEACLYVLLGHPVLSDEPLPIDHTTDNGIISTNHDPFTNHAAIFLLALLDKSAQDNDLCNDMLGRMIELFEYMGPVADVMLDNGLTIVLCNLIITILNKEIELDEKENLLSEVEHFLTCIALKSCETSGPAHFQVFEDLMTLLYVTENLQNDTCVANSYNVQRVQAITFNILLQAMEVMPQCTKGKSPQIQRKVKSVSGWSNYSSQFSFDNISTRSVYSDPPADSLIRDVVFESNNDLPTSPTSSSSARMSTSVVTEYPNLQTPNLSRGKGHRRSASAAPGVDNSLFRSGLRPRSYRVSQRRKVNDGETARRLQCVITIAVERIIFCKHETNDKDITFKTVADNLFPEDEVANGSEILHCILTFNREFVPKVFKTLISWLSTIVSTNTSGRRASIRSHFSGHSGQNSSTFSPAWGRILGIAKPCLIEQTGNLVVNLLSPLQLDFPTRMLPFSLSQEQNAEKLISLLLPLKSANSHKVSVYIYYILCYYKQKMSSQNKKEVKHMCRILHHLGHKSLPLPQYPPAEFDLSAQNITPVDSTEIAHSNQQSLLETMGNEQNKFDIEHQIFCQKCRKQNLANYTELQTRTNKLAEIISSHAMKVTQEVVLKQNIERKKMLSHMKNIICNDLNARKQWSALLEQLAHERAIWYDSKKYPKAWQLDNTEGPNRERRRLQRCHLQIHEKFLLNNTKRKPANSKIKNKLFVESIFQENNDNEPRSFGKGIIDAKQPDCSLKPLAFLFQDDSHSSDSVTIRTRLQTNERIIMVQSCMIVTPSCETPGEILIGENSMYFVGDEVLKDPTMTQALFSDCEVLTLTWQHEEVAEVNKRWWQLQDIAMEIFLTNGKTYLLTFKDVKDRDLIVAELHKANLPNLLQTNDVSKLTQLWRNGQMTNFEYLTQLNKSAGRSFNDLMQYPVMPFVLSDYTSTILDLNNPKSYRNLMKPISVQEQGREEHYHERYNFLLDDYNNCTEEERELRTPPFHYGSHYSNSGTVLHFLVRLPPFTRMFLEYQDASFDIPDRTFHSMDTTYRLSSYSSTTDVKELIPEFFFMPEFLCNLEGFDFGLRQCGLRVHHVNLPPWCKADPRLFVLIHRQALESEVVRAHLQGWIDLVFGMKQSGQEAIDAVNVFHPATYFGMDITSVQDPVKRKALETMVKTYGQTPKQLFTTPHPSMVDKSARNNDRIGLSIVSDITGTSNGNFPDVKSKQNNSSQKVNNLKNLRPLPSVDGLKWGDYIGSPSNTDPIVFLLKPLSTPIGTIVPLQTNDVCALSPKMSLLVVYNRIRGLRAMKITDIHWSALLTYSHSDGIVRIKMKQNTPSVNLIEAGLNDKITCCISGPECKLIVFGKKSGKLTAYKCLPLASKTCDLEIYPGISLYGHGAEITSLVICSEFRILISASKDGSAIVWDLDTLSYVRSLTGHATSVSTVAVSRTSGDICTVCNSGNDKGSHIRLWTINGSLVAAQDSKQLVHCAAFSSAPEGISVNVLAAGLANGVIRLWSSWDLSPIRDIEAHSIHKPIISVAFTYNNKALYAATVDGVIIGWCCKDKIKEKQPLLITFVNAKK